MSLSALRAAYGVPAYKGIRVHFVGGGVHTKAGLECFGRITSVERGQRLRVLTDGGRKIILHPTYKIKYLNCGIVIDDRSDEVPSRPHDRQFDTYAEWVSKATALLQSPVYGPNVAFKDWRPSSLCFDALGRPCWTGDDWNRARDENAFPVRRWFQ